MRSTESFSLKDFWSKSVSRPQQGAQRCVCVWEWIINRCVFVLHGAKFTSTSGPNLSHSGGSTTHTFTHVCFTGLVRTGTEYIHSLSLWTISTWLKHFGNFHFWPFIHSKVDVCHQQKWSFLETLMFDCQPFYKNTLFAFSVTKQPPEVSQVSLCSVFCCLWCNFSIQLLRLRNLSASAVRWL